MISFDAAHRAVHYPPDRRFRIWIRPSILIGIAVAILVGNRASWIEVAVAGLPHVPPVPQIYPNNFAGPHGFPLWVRYCHFFNFLFVMMLIRSGLSILVDHPRLYFNDDCTPGSEWIRFTPLKVPRDRIWTAKDDARYISPLVGTPGYRHTIGIARVWHFINVHGFIVTGIFFVIMLFDTEQWRRIVPTSPLVLLQAWNTWVHYATFHLPAEPNGFYGYNALQQIAYFTVVFVFGPLAMLTGIAMSPAVVNRFPWYARIFGGRQSARSIHFLTMLSFFAFLVVHVTLVVMTGFARNMNHIVLGTDDQRHLGMYLGFVGIGVVVLSWVVAHYISWNHPRGLQHALKSVTYPMQLLTLNRLDSAPEVFRAGYLAVLLAQWKDAGARGLEASGRAWLSRISNSRSADWSKIQSSFRSADIEKLGEIEHITMHHCIQGWSGIAKWGGIPMKTLIELVRPKPEAKSGGLLLLRRSALWRPLLRHAEPGECAEAAMPACVADERPTASGGVWRATAAARRESTRLQDGQVDRAHRVYRVGETAWRGRRRKERGRRILRLAA